MDKISYPDGNSAPLSSENTDSNGIKDEPNNIENAETIEPHKEEHYKTKENSNDSTISQSCLYTVGGGDDDNKDFFKNPEDLVRDWESNHFVVKLPPSIRQTAIEAATIHLVEARGITVKDIEKLGFKQDNAEKKKDDARKIGLFVPLKRRIGNNEQYALSNYKYVLDTKFKKKEKSIVLPNDVTLLLARELSTMKYVYHNFQFETCLN